ncbi:hypothetical protein [Orenia marismortui]|uniref:hypothetical protein n=1 Tax=Orenia marismortui TaxID=46469 RepID=UPI0003762A43|nr:hypothetical protein [Orenia marismortui]
MPLRFISLLKILLLITLGISIIYCWHLYQFSQMNNPVIASQNIDLAKLSKILEQDIKIKEDSKFKYKLDLRGKEWEDIADNNFFNMKEIIDKDLEADNLKGDFPNTNLPTFLAEKKKNKIEELFSLSAISKQDGNSRAIIIDKSNSQSYILKEGAVIKDYLVKEIKEDQVILSFKEAEFRLNFSN